MKLSSRSMKLPSDYMNLIRRFPLRPIRSAAEHKMALAIIDELMAKGEDLATGEGDYFEAVTRFIADWERENVQRSLGKASPLEVLRHLMESREMTSTQLGEVLGSRSAASMVLQGRREMSKAHIRAMADYFGVSPAVFI